MFRQNYQNRLSMKALQLQIPNSGIVELFPTRKVDLLCHVGVRHTFGSSRPMPNNQRRLPVAVQSIHPKLNRTRSLILAYRFLHGGFSMRHLLLGLVVFGLMTTFDLKTGFAQQRSRRSVIYYFQQTSVAKTQFSPDATNPATPSTASTTTDDSPAKGSAAPDLLAAGAQTSGQNSVNSQPSPATTSPAIGFSPPPTNQQLQNPSGGFQFSQTGMTQNPNASQNNYFGSQFNNWSNLRTLPTSLDSVQTFNRTQPSIDSGAYFSPNTYFGPANNQWSNLSTGTVTSNYLGGYIYQQ